MKTYTDYELMRRDLLDADRTTRLIRVEKASDLAIDANYLWRGHEIKDNVLRTFCRAVMPRMYGVVSDLVKVDTRAAIDVFNRIVTSKADKPCRMTVCVTNNVAAQCRGVRHSSRPVLSIDDAVASVTKAYGLQFIEGSIDGLETSWWFRSTNVKPYTPVLYVACDGEDTSAVRISPGWERQLDGSMYLREFLGHGLGNAKKAFPKLLDDTLRVAAAITTDGGQPDEQALAAQKLWQTETTDETASRRIANLMVRYDVNKVTLTRLADAARHWPASSDRPPVHPIPLIEVTPLDLAVALSRMSADMLTSPRESAQRTACAYLVGERKFLS